MPIESNNYQQDGTDALSICLYPRQLLLTRRSNESCCWSLVIDLRVGPKEDWHTRAQRALYTRPSSIAFGSADT